MKQWLFRTIIVGILATLGAFWITLHPSPEKVIRARLNKLARTASIERGQGMIPKALSAEEMADYFTSNVVVSVQLDGHGTHNLNGKDEVREAILAVKQQLAEMKVEFLDINVHIGPVNEMAVANLTCKATVPGESDFVAQEFNFMLRKTEGKWMIYRVETVKTLTALTLRSCA